MSNLGQAVNREYSAHGNDYHEVNQPTRADRMGLSADERNLAINIKEAIGNATAVEPVSDFMCAQLALIDGDDIEAAVKRVHHLQCFKEEYGILDSVVDGRRCFERYFDLMPGLHLCFVDDISMDNTIMVYDNTKFSCKRIRSEESVRAWLGGSYYTLTIFAPDFEAIRKGAVLVAECEGYDWKADMDFKSLKRVWTEIATVYPVTIAKVKYFNSGTTMNLVASMLRPFLPKPLRERIEFGCKFDQRLDQVYLTPSLEEATARMLIRIEETLHRRYENERNFRL